MIGPIGALAARSSGDSCGDGERALGLGGRTGDIAFSSHPRSTGGASPWAPSGASTKTAGLRSGLPLPPSSAAQWEPDAIAPPSAARAPLMLSDTPGATGARGAACASGFGRRACLPRAGEEEGSGASDSTGAGAGGAAACAADAWAAAATTSMLTSGIGSGIGCCCWWAGAVRAGASPGVRGIDPEGPRAAPPTKGAAAAAAGAGAGCAARRCAISYTLVAVCCPAALAACAA